MHLAPHFFPGKLRFVKTAGCAACKIFPNHGIRPVHGKRLLCQQDLCTGALLHPLQQFQIPAEPGFIHNIAGRWHSSRVKVQGFQFLHRRPSGYGTSIGLKFSRQGRPHLFRASINGSGSNSSILYTPGLFHLPVSNIIAPIIAGTPVV